MSSPFHSTLSAAIAAGCAQLGLSDDATAKAFEGFRPFLMPLPGDSFPVQTVTVETGRNMRFATFAHLTITRTDGQVAPYEVVGYTSKCTLAELDAHERGVTRKAR